MIAGRSRTWPPEQEERGEADEHIAPPPRHFAKDRSPRGSCRHPRRPGRGAIEGCLRIDEISHLRRDSLVLNHRPVLRQLSDSNPLVPVSGIVPRPSVGAGYSRTECSNGFNLRFTFSTSCHRPAPTCLFHVYSSLLCSEPSIPSMPVARSVAVLPRLSPQSLPLAPVPCPSSLRPARGCRCGHPSDPGGA